MAHNSIDALRLLNILKTQENLIAFTMGEKGRFLEFLHPLLALQFPIHTKQMRKLQGKYLSTNCKPINVLLKLLF